jgi:transposase|tara:strand:- start:2252 stop:2431 length:180 start_codon:yes stop_codon:yes gene_type:complete
MTTLVRIAALYKIEDAIRGSAPEHRRAVRQELSRPLVDQFFAWLAAPGPASQALSDPAR